MVISIIKCSAVDRDVDILADSYYFIVLEVNQKIVWVVISC